MGGQVSKESDKLRSSGDKLAWKATHTKKQNYHIWEHSRHSEYEKCRMIGSMGHLGYQAYLRTVTQESKQHTVSAKYRKRQRSDDEKASNPYKSRESWDVIQVLTAALDINTVNILPFRATRTKKNRQITCLTSLIWWLVGKHKSFSWQICQLVMCWKNSTSKHTCLSWWVASKYGSVNKPTVRARLLLR